jgi:hypothetical protein
VVYVSAFDSEGCVRIGGNNQIIRTRVLAFAFVDVAGGLAPAGVREVLLSPLANIAGVSVDDDGSLYVQFVDLIQFTGGAIFKWTELRRNTGESCFGCINRTLAPPVIPIFPTSIQNGVGTTANPIGVVSGFYKITNYSGASLLFGDVVALANGGCNVLYAAVSASFVPGAVSFEQLTQGLFPAPGVFTAGTPSMIISFADCSGAFDVCSGDATGSINTNVGGILPAADGFADVAQNGLTLTPGVNNFRIFAQGNGPNLAPLPSGTAIVPGTPTGLLQVAMQIDYTLHSGLAVNEQNTVFVISGGTPAGIGKNPSPMLGEVLCFEDGCPADRRADFVDLRGDILPNPPASGGTTGDGDSDRFDHIFYQAPLDQVTLTPGGLAGLADGFLRYTNRLAPFGMGINRTPTIIDSFDVTNGQALGVTGGARVLGDDATLLTPIVWESLDPGHQVAGGDDQNPPFRGDDSDGWANPTPHPYPASDPGNPLLFAPLEGGFEFIFGEEVTGASGTLAAALLAADGIFTISPFLTSGNAAAGFPFSGELTITSTIGGVVVSEVVHYTRSGNQFTIVRGQYGTVPRAHPAGALVRFGSLVTDQLGCSPWVWNGFFWNSNGNITFLGGDKSNFPTVPGFRLGLPKIAPAWADLNPLARLQNCGTFPVMAVGFANVNAFKTRWINVPEFGSEDCTAVGLTGIGGLGLLGNSGASNTFSVTLFDDGTGFDENTAEVLSIAINTSGISPIGDNLNNGTARFDQFEGPTDLRWTREPNTLVLVGCSPRPEGSGIIIFDYCRMDLLGTFIRPVLTGYSIGFLDPLNPPGMCEINMSKAAAAADANPFGVLPDTNGQTANICANCCIGEGTEPTLFEFFNEGLAAGTGAGGEITFSRPDFDLRFEGNDALLCTSVRQRDLNRGRVCLFGVGCKPANPVLCAPGTGSIVVPGTFVTPVPPTGLAASTGVINALCAVQLNVVGCGFFPNETTIICQGFQTETGVPLLRDGKQVTTAASLLCDSNGDGVLDATIVLTPVTPVNCNLVRATIPVLASRPGTGFPDACCGGLSTITVTTTFTAGDNNVFGLFTRTATCTLALGTRAPVVFSVTPSDGSCALPIQDLLISGACFCSTTAPVPTVTSVVFVDKANPANKITVGLNPSTSGQLKPLTCQLLDVEVNFTSANAGKTFLVYVIGPGGTSRNLTAAVAGAPAGCPLGNEQGVQVTFTCSSSTTPGGDTPPTEIAVVTGCKLDRQDTGQFFLDVTTTGAKQGATATVGGVTPKKIKVVAVQPGTTNPTTLRLVKKVCNGLPGNVIITNPGPNGAPSQPFNCTERCPAQ